jgi:hypothetical protein
LEVCDEAALSVDGTVPFPSDDLPFGTFAAGWDDEAGPVEVVPISFFAVFVTGLDADCPSTGTVTANAISIIKNKVLHKRIMDPLQHHSERAAPPFGALVLPLCSAKLETANSNQSRTARLFG